MNIQLRQVKSEDREILRNLLEKYDYEFSQYDNRDVNKLGLYGYQYLDYYWTVKNRWAYFIEADGNLAGFVMVNDYPEVEDRKTDFVISEFFVMYKYRRSGIGKQAFFKVLDLHKGTWSLKRHPKNIPSVYFWNKAINEYTNGNFEMLESYPNIVYDDGTLADVFFFESYEKMSKKTEVNVMENIEFRRMKVSDIPTVVKLRKLQLNEEGADETFDITENLMDYFMSHMDDGTFIGYVAVTDDEIIATSGMSFCEKPPYYSNPTGKIGILSCMYTIEGYRRKGIAKRLLETVVNEARELGCGTIYITASKQGALLYESYGFKRNEKFFQLTF